MILCLLIHLAVTWILVGLIWVVQIVVYPQFLRAGQAEFQGYHFAHCSRIGFVVAPLLLLEAASAALLLYLGMRDPAFLVSVALMAGNWLCTAALQAPQHTRLMHGYDAALIRRLIRGNWLRTLAWTARGVLVTLTVITLLSLRYVAP